MQRSDSQRTAPAVDPQPRYRASGRVAAGARRLIFIVASPRPQVGKTFLARLLFDFLRLDGAAALAFDLNPSGEALRDQVPAIASDIGDTRGEVALFDRLIADDGAAKVVDVGYAAFERFFAIAQEIRFFEALARRSIEAAILVAADAHPSSVRAYAELQQRLAGVPVVPVFNEAIVKGQALRVQFRLAWAAAVPLQVSELPPLLKTQIDRCSFVDLHDRVPKAVPYDLAFELRAWTRRTFLEFRELELRLLLERLRGSLPGIAL